MREQPRATVVTSTRTYMHAAWKVRRGYTDGIEFRLCEEEGVIHVRSASRFCPLRDSNANGKRIESVLALFEQRDRRGPGPPPTHR